MSIIEIIFIGSIWCIGVYKITEEGMLLAFVRKALKPLPKLLMMPLIDCLTCMASIHGTLIYWSGVNYDHSVVYLLLHWVIVVIAISGLNNILSYFAFQESDPDYTQELIGIKNAIRNHTDNIEAGIKNLTAQIKKLKPKDED